MKKLIIALFLMTMTMAAARAEITLYAAEGTISGAQAQALADALDLAFAPEAEVVLRGQEESIAQQVFSGNAPGIAVLDAQQAALWARAEMLVPLDGCTAALENMDQTLADACVFGEQLMFAPLLARSRMMAVRPERFEDVDMGYLLDERAHPVWYPSELMQALDEMALIECPGMDVWPPQTDDSLWLEALLQGVADMDLTDFSSAVGGAEGHSLQYAMSWLEDMLRAGLITAQESREAALARFLAGETAIFPDWTAALSEAYAQEIKREEILLRPYPSQSGEQRKACDVIVLCAFSTGDDREDERLREAIAVLLEAKTPETACWRRSVYDDGARCLPLLCTREYGATLRALLCEAARAVIAGEESAQSAVGRIDRAMRTMGW